MQSEIEKFDALKIKHSELEKKKIRLEEQFKSKKERLAEIVKQIREEGHDPSKLKEIIEEKEATLKQSLDAFEKELEKASSELSAIEV